MHGTNFMSKRNTEKSMTKYYKVSNDFFKGGFHKRCPTFGGEGVFKGL